MNENNLPANTGNIVRTPAFKNNSNPSSKEVADKHNSNIYND
jgi:hypothetical protein